MKFKKLHIHNLASLEEAEIDFGHAPLDNPIFLICGETGSGKSTLLDAVCLALYDSSPRFKSSSADKYKREGVFGEVTNNSPMQILRENADKGFAELVFEGNDGREYTARWAVRRIRKRGMDEHENARDWTLSFVEEGTEITLKKIEEVKSRIEEAVGLNFEQFCRTSMLAQGEFTKFLKSNDTEKSAILEKLTDTGHFARMGTRIYEKAAGKKRLWEQAGRDMENIQVLSEEQMAEKETERTALTANIARLSEETQALKKRYEWRKKQEELKHRKAEADEAVKRAQEGVNGEDYRNGKRLWQEWEVSEEARKWWEQSKTAEREAMAAQEGLQAQAREFSVLLGGEKYLEAYIKDLEAETAKWESRAGMEKGAVVDIPQEENVLRAYAQARNSAERFLEKNATARKTETEAADLEKACAELASHTEELTKKAQEAEERLKNAEEDLRTLQKGVGDVAKGLRATLSEGEICPVCGNKIEKLLTDEYFETLYAPAKKRWEEAERLHKAADNALKTNLAERKAKEESREAAKRRLQESRSQLAEAEALLRKTLQLLPSAPEFVPEKGEDLVAFLVAEEKRRQERMNVLQEWQKVRMRWEKCLQPYHDAVALVEELRGCLEESGNIQSFDKQEQKGLIGRLSDVKSKVVSLQDRRASALRQKEAWIKALSDFYARHPGITEARLAQLLQNKEQIEKIKVFCKQKDDELTAALALQVQMAKDGEMHAANRPAEETDQDTVEALATLLTAKEREREENHRRLGAIEQLLRAEEAQRRKLLEKKAEMERLSKDYERWERLNKLFGSADGNKFRKIVLNFMMDELLSHANEHLRRLTDRYRLESSFGSFVILVRDLHDGGSLRSASSLSGGESFLVSLALALGLSSFNGARVTTDILFIDEGFGTLSGNALEPAVSALERLHNSDGRKVAIISHVAALRERIRTQIRVERVDPTKSRIRVVG